MSGDTCHNHVDATWNPRGVTHGMSHVMHLCEWLTLNHVSKEGNKRKRKNIKKIKKDCGEDMWHVGMRVGRWGGSFSTWTIWWMKEKKRKIQTKGKEKRKYGEKRK